MLIVFCVCVQVWKERKKSKNPLERLKKKDEKLEKLKKCMEMLEDPEKVRAESVAAARSLGGPKRPSRT